MPALFSTYAYYNSDKFHFYGEDLMKHMMAFRSFMDAGITVAPDRISARALSRR